jgi:hypothetical protein
MGSLHEPLVPTPNRATLAGQQQRLPVSRAIIVPKPEWPDSDEMRREIDSAQAGAISGDRIAIQSNFAEAGNQSGLTLVQPFLIIFVRVASALEDAPATPSVGKHRGAHPPP